MSSSSIHKSGGIWLSHRYVLPTLSAPTIKRQCLHDSSLSCKLGYHILILFPCFTSSVSVSSLIPPFAIVCLFRV